MLRRISVPLMLLAGVLAAPGTAAADPLTLDSPRRFTDQRFEWRGEYSRRWEGAYGQVQVALDGGTTYEFFTHDAYGGTTRDPYLYVLDEAGEEVLARNDDGGEGRNARVVYTPADSGTYTIRLRAYRRDRYGFCSVTLRGPSNGSDPSGGGDREIRPGDSLQAQTFEWQSGYASRWSGTYGQYRVEMRADTLYRFEVSDASGAYGDSYLYLFDEDLRGVWWDDDGGSGYQSKLLFRPVEDGTYYLRLRSYYRGTSGSCTLTVSTGERSGETPVLPDLITLDAYLTDAHVSTADGVRRLRFSNGAANRGGGPMKVYGLVDAAGDTRAYQVVYNADGSRTGHPVGIFVFSGHEDHNHWHYDGFANYALHDRDSGDKVAESAKVTFCLMDTARYTGESVPNTPSSPRYDCENQGISPGWLDVYGYELDGQDIDITGVPDGYYHLSSTANPAGKLHETSTSNNEARILVEIRGNSARVVR